MFSGEFSVFAVYGMKKLWLNYQAKKNPDKAAMLLSPGTRQAGEK